MKNKLNITSIALIISTIALFVSAINILFCALNKQDTVTAIILFCCMLAVLCSNIASYCSAKNDTKAKLNKRI